MNPNMRHTTRVCIVIAEEDEIRLATWDRHIRGIPVHFVQVEHAAPPLKWLDESGGVDCIIVPALWGLDITGSRPKENQAQLIPAFSEQVNISLQHIRWFAIPPVLRRRTQQTVVALFEDEVGSYEWVYQIFVAIFRAILEFNSFHLEQICRVGFWGNEQSFLSGDPRIDAPAIVEAYHRCFG